MRVPLAWMFTITTYGTWLRGDRRGWVDDGVVMPPDPELENADRRRLKHPIFHFQVEDLPRVGEFIGRSLTKRLGLEVLALSADTWHVHFVVGASEHSFGTIVKCAKDAVRNGLRPGRPIWTTGYDKRFCFDEKSIRARVRYVERHKEAKGWPAWPWKVMQKN